MKSYRVLTLAALLASCAGFDEDESTTSREVATAVVHPLAATSTWVPLRPINDPLLQNLTIPADAPTRGMWSSSVSWPLNAVHSILLPDERVLTFGTPFGNAATQDGRYYDLWTPSKGLVGAAHVSSTVPDPVNSFCSTSGWLQDGRLLVSGGNGGGGKSSGLFTVTLNTSTADPASLSAERWYATMLTLPDSRQIILGGTVPYGSPNTSQTPEIYEGGRWRSLFGASSTPMFGVRRIGTQAEANPWYYPRAWVAPDGSVFGITSNIMFSMRPNDNAGSGSVTQVGTFKTPQDSSGATTPNVGFTSTAVMFEPGRILQVGGNGITDNNPNQASNLASVFDINGMNPVVTETAPMTHRRHWSNATVLPDGRVVVTGGTTVGWDPANAVRPAEIWSPATGTWTVGASNVETRTYHSSAILLPNATVFTAGGGAPGAVNNLNAELYYPPQLFTTVGGAAQLAPRPVLTAISALEGTYGGSLGIQLADATQVSKVSLVALGSTTHSFNNTQRRVPLQFAQNDTQLTLTLPASANLAPPGYYMVFVMNANGVPSRGTVIAIGGVLPPPVQNVSALPSDAVACGGEGTNCVLPTGRTGTIYYGANGTYAIRTGRSGTVACNNAVFGDPLPGTFKTCAYVLDSVPLTLPAVSAPPVTAGSTVSYTPNVALNGATYSWRFGDGSADTATSASPNINHTFTAAGVYRVTWTATLQDGSIAQSNFMQAVGNPAVAGRPSASTPLALETRAGASARLWVVNPDTDTVSVIDTATKGKVAEISVGKSPRSVAIAPDGRVWVTNKDAATISIVSTNTLAVVQTVALPYGSRPHGLAFVPGGGTALVVLEATGQVLQLDAGTGGARGTLGVGPNPRHVSVSANGATALVSRFITVPLPGESTAAVDTSNAGGEVLVINLPTLTVARTVVLRHSDKVDSESQGAGVPNYLAAAAIAPDGKSAWVPSKQDNIKRGTLRSGQNLSFQNAVRAIASRLDLSTSTEDYARRVDLDNAGVASAALYHPSGAYLFVALETSNQVSVVDAAAGAELFRFDVGRAPQGLAISGDGQTLYVQHFMDRSVGIVDLTPLLTQGRAQLGGTVIVSTIGVETLSATVLRGKRLFYDARDPRLARDAYLSCASCHNDGAHDGRTWDLTGFGEGLRNTIALKGRAGMSQGLLHWSANFDEVQDFEGQIRNLAGGTGLMNDADYNTGARSTPLGDRKAGISADLDALAAYLGSLSRFDSTPYRNADASLTAAAAAGKTVFASAGCANCHGGESFTSSLNATTLKTIGTIKPSTGQRLGGTLNGIDTPTLRDVWASSPYLHDGSAPTLTAAVQAHNGVTVTAADLPNLVAYLQQIGAEETAAPYNPSNPASNLAPTATLDTSYVSPWETLGAINNNVTPGNSADHSTGAYGNWRGASAYGATDWIRFTWPAAKTLSAFEVYWWNDGQGIGTPTYALVEYWNGSAWVSLGSPGLTLNTFNRLAFGPVTTTSIRVSMKSALATGILEARTFGTDAAPVATNLAPTATLDTSYVSPWEKLGAVNNNMTPGSSADHSTGAYGNWRGAGAYGATDWVRFTWPAAKTLSAFEAYWWNDGQGIGTPTYALVEYWNGSAWVSLGSPGLTLNVFNRLAFAPVTTTSVRVSMRSALATGILEARTFGY